MRSSRACSSYRSSAVALGTLALYALLITGVTARYTKRLPAGVWLKIHRLSLVVFVLAWVHGVLAGTDSRGSLPALPRDRRRGPRRGRAYRYWVIRSAPAASRPSIGGQPATVEVCRPMNSLPLPARRALVVVGVVAVIGAGVASIRVAAEWRPLRHRWPWRRDRVESMQVQLADESARAEALASDAAALDGAGGRAARRRSRPRQRPARCRRRHGGRASRSS